MEEIKAMLTELAWTQKVEFSNFMDATTFENAIGKESMYFLWWVVDKGKRNKDEDIKKKCYFYVDIDIRSVKYQSTGKVISDQELFDEIDKIIEALTVWNLSSMRYVVFTGNGIHLYFVWTEREFDPRVFANGVQYVYEIIDFALQELWYTCDTACKNIARIARLPWSINRRLKTAVNKETKEKEIIWDLEPIECKILYINPEIDKTIFDSLESYAKEQRNEIAEAQQIKTYEAPKSDIWAEINKIDIVPIVCNRMWLKVKNQNKDTITLYDEKRAIWAYIYKPYNILKRTGTTRLDRETYTVYEFVLFEICNNDTRATKERFEKHYNVVFDKYEKKYLEANIKIPTKKYFEWEWYRYPDQLFDDDFEILRSGELCLIASPTNSWKSTFAQGIVARNKDKHKCLYINLEFDLERWWEDARKRSKGMKVKIKWTKIDPYTDYEEAEMKNYIAKCRSKMEILDMSQGTTLEEIIAKIQEHLEKWYSLFVIDTFSSIEKADEYDKQNLIIRKLHDICKVTGAVILAVHHFNKDGKKISGSQKLSDLANVVVTLQMEQAWPKRATRYNLDKDKAFFGKKSKLLILEWWEYKQIAESDLSDDNF